MTEDDGKTDVVDKDNNKIKVSVAYNADNNGAYVSLSNTTVTLDKDGKYLVTFPAEAKGKDVIVTITNNDGIPVSSIDVSAVDCDGCIRGTKTTDEEGRVKFNKDTGVTEGK